MAIPTEARLFAGVLIDRRYGIAVALFPADELSELEVQRAPDSAGSPNVGAAETVAYLPPGERLFVDELPPGVVWHYRIRATLPGYDPSGWTCWAMATSGPLPEHVNLPDVVLPIIAVTRAVSGTTGTLTLTITDPQCRVTQVEFRTKVGAAAYSSWAVDASVPYEQTVTITPGVLSLIGYRVTGYDGLGTLRVLAEGEETYNADHLIGMLSLAASFDETGVLKVRAIGDVQTGSIRLAVSTSAFPSSGTVGAVTAVDGRQSEWTFAGPYALGDALYLSAIAYTGAAGAGTASDKIDSLVYRANSVVSKTIRLPAAGLFGPYVEGNGFNVASGYFTPDVASEGNIGFFSPPKGATLTAVRFRTWTHNAGASPANEIVCGVARVGQDGAWTTLGSDDASSTYDAWETLAVSSLAEDTAGDRAYVARFSTNHGVAGSGHENRLAWIEYDIDVPSVDVST